MSSNNLKYYILFPNSHKHLHLFDDLKEKNNINLMCTSLKNCNKFLAFFRNIHLSYSLNRLINLPYKTIWYKDNYFDVSNKNYIYNIVIMDGSLKFMNIKWLNKISKEPNINLVLVLINSMEAESVSMVESKPLINKVEWTSIWTFDPIDSAKYGYKYLGLSYYSKAYLQPAPVEYDAYFVGGFKGGRNEKIIKLFEKLKHDECICNFNIMISGINKIFRKKSEKGLSFFSGGWKSYNEVLQDVNKSNCIIEILQTGQTGQSLRYLEAVCYNKKLLTNNKYIKNLPFYNPNNMKIYENINDIDTNWIKQQSKINYEYNDEFSPVHMLNKIFMKGN